jgi:hypothetical protein
MINSLIAPPPDTNYYGPREAQDNDTLPVARDWHVEMGIGKQLLRFTFWIHFSSVEGLSSNY